MKVYLEHSAVAAVAALICGCAAAPEDRDAGISDEIIFFEDSLSPMADGPVTCREMLRPGSNVIVRRCMSRRAWEEFRRRQARDAQALVRAMQRGIYSGGAF